MADYKELYFRLFNSITQVSLSLEKTLIDLRTAQLDTEEQYISSGENTPLE